MGGIGQRWEEEGEGDGDGDGGRTRRRRGEDGGDGRRSARGEEERGEEREEREEKREEVGRRRIIVGGMLEVEGCQNQKRRGKRKSFLLLPLVQSRGRFLCGRPLARWCAPPCLSLSLLRANIHVDQKPLGHGCVCSCMEAVARRINHSYGGYSSINHWKFLHFSNAIGPPSPSPDPSMSSGISPQRIMPQVLQN